MPVHIVTDSTCDLPPDLVARYGIQVVPAVVNIGERSFRDGLDLSRTDFYRQLPSLNPLPTTAAPSAGAFTEAYQRCGAGDIVAITLASKLSAMYNAARLGAEALPGRVTLIDSAQVSMGLGWQVLAAAEAAAAGRALSDVVAAVQSVQQRVALVAALDTIEYLRRGGRASALSALVGQVLQIKLLLEVRDGQVVPIERLRTAPRARQGVLDRIRALGPLQRAAVLHVAAPEVAQSLAEQVAPLTAEPPVIVEATSVIGTHAGPGAVGVAAVQAA